MDVLGEGGRAASGRRAPAPAPELLKLPLPLSLDFPEVASVEKKEADGRQLPPPGTYARVTS